MRILILLLFFSTAAFAQPCSTIPGMNPSTAILACGTTAFMQNTVIPCTGPDISTNCLANLVSGRSFFYKFHVYTTPVGGLEFTITPESPLDDFDWTLFDITGHADPNIIYTDITTQVSVNLCGFTGETGCSTLGISNLNCEGNTNLWNQPAPVLIGHDYLLMVTNWSNSGSGYTLDFPGGDTVIVNNAAPTITNVVTSTCNSLQLPVLFSEDIKCSSLTSNGNEFVIMPGNIVPSSITSLCTSGASSINQLLFNLTTPLPPGNYNLVVNLGTDGNTVLDACDVGMIPGTQIPFTISSSGAPLVSDVASTSCSFTSVNVTLSEPVLCSTITSTGSEFSIPGGPSVLSVTTNCTPSQIYTSNIQLNLSAPVANGNHQLIINNGTDGNTITDTCNASIPTGYSFPFTIIVPDADFTSQVKWGCVNDTIQVSHPAGGGVNSWTWTFTNGTVLNTQSGSAYFPVSTVSAGVQLIVSNGNCSDTSSATFPLNNAFNSAFSQSADTTCVGKDITFVNESTGSNLSYEWQFGDNTFYMGNTPTPHTYSANNSYTVNLICSNIHGCRDTATRTIYATAVPSVSFSGLNAQYCTRERVTLTANLQGYIQSYSWNTGNGQTLNNQPVINYTYNNQNDFPVTLTAVDRFCGISTYSETTSVYLVPVVDLGNDTVLCPSMRMQLGVQAISDMTYAWNTGQTTSQIITSLNTQNYILTIDNHGCKTNGDIHVEMLDGCLIRVPGAFTPNNDGLNDKLKAINAFLAKDFNFRVYNRFGQLVFVTTNPSEGWDGLVKGNVEGTGTYVWQLSYIDPWTKQPVYQKGTSILIR